MKCFNHPTADAVAICRGCGRALCPGCIAEVGLTCSCRGRCEETVATLNELTERGRTAYQKTSATFFRSGIFISLMGLTFLVVGAFTLASGAMGEMCYFFLVAGFLFFSYGLSQFVAAKRLLRK